MAYKIMCDMCGKEFDEYDTQEHFGIHTNTIGYGSCYDGDTINVDMCCNCFDKLMQNYILQNLCEKPTA